MKNRKEKVRVLNEILNGKKSIRDLSHVSQRVFTKVIGESQCLEMETGKVWEEEEFELTKRQNPKTNFLLINVQDKETQTELLKLKK